MSVAVKCVMDSSQGAIVSGKRFAARDETRIQWTLHHQSLLRKTVLAGIVKNVGQLKISPSSHPDICIRVLFRVLPSQIFRMGSCTKICSVAVVPKTDVLEPGSTCARVWSSFVTEVARTKGFRSMCYGYRLEDPNVLQWLIGLFESSYPAPVMSNPRFFT